MTLWFAVALLVLLVGLFALARRSRSLAVPVTYASEQHVVTEDGQHICLRRLNGEGPSNGRPPVLMVHGICSNHRNVDPHPQRSMARYLAARGRDVWLLTLRTSAKEAVSLRHVALSAGSGSTGTRVRLPLHKIGPRHVVRLPGSAWRGVFGHTRHRLKWMAQKDLPLAIETVLAQTRAAQIDYVGFSMGGMLLYAALSAGLESRVLRRVAIVGAPAAVRPLGPLAIARFLPRFLTPTLRVRVLARLFAPSVGLFPRFFHRVVYNPGNASLARAQQSMVDLVEDLPGQLGADFVRWAYYGHVRIDGRPILEALRDVDAPARFFAGKADQIAPPDTVRAGFEAWGAGRERVDKDFTLLAAEQGAGADYGHGDMMFGDHADADVFRPVHEFLAAEG